MKTISENYSIGVGSSLSSTKLGRAFSILTQVKFCYQMPVWQCLYLVRCFLSQTRLLSLSDCVIWSSPDHDVMPPPTSSPSPQSFLFTGCTVAQYLKSNPSVWFCPPSFAQFGAQWTGLEVFGHNVDNADNHDDGPPLTTKAVRIKKNIKMPRNIDIQSLFGVLCDTPIRGPQ